MIMNEIAEVQRASSAQTKIAPYRSEFGGARTSIRAASRAPYRQVRLRPDVRQPVAARCAREAEIRVRSLSRTASSVDHLRALAGVHRGFSPRVVVLMGGMGSKPLAGLFTQVAREIPAGVQGAERARSASEAYLFRRLQGLPETRDRIRVNGRLPTPFSEDGRMEVDYLDRELKLVPRAGCRPLVTSWTTDIDA